MQTPKYKKISKHLALKALLSLDSYAFGNDKGSDELYQEWCEENNLVPEWDEDRPLTNDDIAPSFIELFLAIGITPQEIHSILKDNPCRYPKELTDLYGFEPIEEES